MEVFYIIFIFIIGLYCGSFFMKIGNRLPKNEEFIFDSSKCQKCNHKLNIKDTIPVLSYIFLKRKCRYCSEKISIFYPIFELITAFIFLICYFIFKNVFPENLNIIFSFLFISALLLIIVCDIKYMIIPNELLIFFTVLLFPIRVFILYKLNDNINFLDIGYEILFMIIDAFIIFSIMYIIKLIGDLMFKSDSMGGGDIKMMSFISLFLGWRLSIVIIFIGSFIALPISIINMYLKKEHVLAFGPYLSIATMIIYLLRIDYNSILQLIM